MSHLSQTHSQAAPLNCRLLRLRLLFASTLFGALLVGARASDFYDSLLPKLELPHDIAPFDDETLLPSEHGEQQWFYPLGYLKPLDSCGTPNFFPVHFSIHTPSGDPVTGIEIHPTEYSIRLQNSTKQVENHVYEFDLSKFLKPTNPFDPTRRTIILIHGYNSGESVDWYDEFRDAWFKLENVNVIYVNWPEGSRRVMYETALANTKLVARQVTMFLYYLAETQNLDFKSIAFRESLYLVGHSLGAHIAGFVGKELRGQVARITGLDPAGPIIDRLPAESRLNKRDAQFVDVMHTNAGRMTRIYVNTGMSLLKQAANKIKMPNKAASMSNLTANAVNEHQSPPESTPWFGIETALGHIDYYPNGGSIQPGCNDYVHVCDHGRAIELYKFALQYEFQARTHYGPGSELILAGNHRLVAFPASDYKKFKSGATLLRHCPSLLKPNKLEMSDRERFEAYKKCTIPIDFVTPTRELRPEMERVYGIDFESHDPAPGDFDPDNLQEERQYYFDTMAQEPYLVEQYLLRVHLSSDEQAVKWTHGCRLLQISHHLDEVYSIIQFDPTMIRLTETDNFFGLSIPFANPVDWRTNYPSERNIKEAIERGGLRLYVPDSFWLGISYTLADGKLRRAFNSLSNLFSSSKVNGTHETQCQLVIKQLEVRPLVAVTQNIAAWYVNFTGTYDRLDIGDRAAMAERARRLTEPLTLDLNQPSEMMHLVSIGLDLGTGQGTTASTTDDNESD